MSDIKKDQSQKPPTLTVIPENIPLFLRSRAKWVGWRWEWRNGWTKPPVNLRTGRHASATDPETWFDFERAVGVYQDERRGFALDGIGYVLQSTDGIVGIDLDKVFDPETGEMVWNADDVISTMETYAEWSPTHTGYRAFVLADMPGESCKTGKVEVYNSGRYMTCTGHKLLSATDDLMPRQNALNAYYAHVFPPAEIKPKPPKNGVHPVSSGIVTSLSSVSDNDLIDVARNSRSGRLFEQLFFSGDLSGYGDDASAADLALCNILAFYTGCDEGQMDRLFRQSALMRDKWDRDDYRERTMRLAVQSCHETYTPPGVVNTTPLQKLGYSAARENAAMDNGTDSGEEGGALGTPSEMALATAWAEYAKDKLAYVEGDQWFAYRDGRWLYSSHEIAHKSCMDFLNEKKAKGEKTKFTDDRKIVVNRAKITGVIFLGKSLLGPHALSEFDAKPGWIGMRNGVFDIETSRMLPHAPEHLLTRQVPYEYDAFATCPTWKQFLTEVMLRRDKSHSYEWEVALQEWFGLALMPTSDIQAAHFWVGEGGNGKGVATRALQNLVGAEYCCEIPVEQLHDPYHRADLQGKSVGFVNEPDRKAMQKNGNQFKKITGGDTISARRPSEKVFNFVFAGRIILSCNELPSTNDLSSGYFRRVLLIEWRYNVPAEKRDKDLDEKLRAEMPGIFNWAIQGLRRVRANGRLSTAEESETLLASYRKNEDVFARFFEECCKVKENATVSVEELYSAYKKWHKENGEYMASSHKVVDRMERLGFERSVGKRKITGENTWKSVKLWTGFELRSDDEIGSLD